MKRNSVVNIIIIFLIMLSPIFVNAITVTTGVVTADLNLRIRKGPGVSYEQIGTATYNSTVTILSYKDTGDGCTDKWIEIKSSTGVQGFVCSTYIGNITTKEVNEEQNQDDTPITPAGQEMANMTAEEFEQYLTTQGFPEDYKVKLRALHAKHPTWIFKAVKSKYTWTNALNEQDKSGTSLLNVNPTYAQNGYEGYLSVAEADYDHDNDKFLKHDGTYWFQANRQTIAYYMDPRNFLDEKKVFMFEELFYYPSYQKIDVVKYTLSSDFLKQFAQYFMEGAQVSKVSPIYLAALSKQEVGTSNTNICTNGKAGVLSDGVNYSGYYNFFNIGASSSLDPKLKSLQHAKGKEWNSQQKSIVEGSKVISNNYVNCGQYTSYFQKFNTAITATKGIWHQYTTNISALVSPANSTYNAYNNFNLIEKDFVFAIPVYTGMPTSTSLPKLGNPNNWLKTLTVNGSLVTNFDNDKLAYTVTVPYSESVNIGATPVNSKAKVAGTGTIALTGDTTIIKVIVTAQNESTKTYTITINREKKPEEIITPPEDNIGNDNNGDENSNIGDDNNNDNQVIPTVPDEPVINLDDVLKAAGYKINGSYLSNVTFGTSVSTITNKLINKYPTVTINIYDRNNKSKSSGTIVTGDKVTLSNNGNTKTITIVIYGDTSGDGKISGIDLLNTQKHILGKTKLQGAYLKAADTNKDGKISGIDLLNMQKHVLGKLVISQN